MFDPARLSPLTGRVDASGIRRVFDMARTMKDPVNLGIGQPHFPTPDPLIEAAARAVRGGANAYTPTQGDEELIALLRAEVTAKGRAPDDLFITSGVSGGILLAFMALLAQGDEFILPDPYFVMYKQLAEVVGAKAVLLDTYPDFRLDAAAVERLVTPRTRLLVLNNPANPTGRLFSQAEIDGVVDVARRHGLVLLSDEIYDAFQYVREPFQPVPSPWAKYENTLLLGGFSKTYSVTGWRLGYAAGPEPVLQAMKKLQQYSFVCAPSFAQKAICSAFTPETKAIIAAHVRAYAAKRDRLVKALTPFAGLRAPEGAFYAFLEAPGGDGDRLVERLLEAEVLTVPGSVFSARKSHIRLSFATSDERLDEGLRRMTRVFETLSR